MPVKSLNREILRLALPSILANITVPIVGMVDIAVAGHLHGSGLLGAAAFIGGITIGSMLFDLLYWNFGFLRVATGGLTAQAFGRGDMKDCAKLLSRAVLLALGFSALLLLLQWPFTRLAFLVVQCSPEVKELALKYFFIRIWAAPATLGLMAFRGWFIGMQDSVSSMMTDLVVNIVNIVASIVLAAGISFGGGAGISLGSAGTGAATAGFGFAGLGFPGIALGTVTAQYSGLLYACAKTFLKYRKPVFAGLSISDVKSSFRGAEMRGFMSMNGDIFIRSLCFTAVYIGMTTISARYGDLMLASTSILMKLLMIFSFFTDGFAYAGEALTGRFIGAREPEMMRRAVKYVFAWSMSIVLFFVAGYWFGSTPLLQLMTSDAEVIQACRQFLPWLVLMPLIGCPAFTWDGIYLGATASKGVRDAMLAAVLAFFCVWFAGIGLYGRHAARVAGMSMAGLASSDAAYQAGAMHILLAAYFAHLAARAIVLTALYKREVISKCHP